MQPTFLFIERSSEREPAFPIEVYLSGPDEVGDSFLVNPEGIHRWDGWPREFLVVHDIRDEDVRVYGTPPVVICSQLAPILTSHLIYSQAPDRDRRLLQELFAAAELPCPELRLDDVRTLYMDMLLAKGYDVDHSQILLDSLATQVRGQFGCRGGAFELPFLWGLWHTVRKTEDAPN